MDNNSFITLETFIVETFIAILVIAVLTFVYHSNKRRG